MSTVMQVGPSNPSTVGGLGTNFKYFPQLQVRPSVYRHSTTAIFRSRETTFPTDSHSRCEPRATLQSETLRPRSE